MRFEMFRSSNFRRWAAIPLRLIVGFGFMQHGYAKLAKGPEAFAMILQSLGVPGAHLMAWLTIFTELIGGAAVLAGAFITFASVPMTAVLLVAMFKVHLRYGFSSIKLMAITPSGARFGPPGYECDLLYIACLVALVHAGSGPFAVDRYFRLRERTDRYGACACRLGSQDLQTDSRKS
jgi:putative oxidoreductase